MRKVDSAYPKYTVPIPWHTFVSKLLARVINMLTIPQNHTCQHTHRESITAVFSRDSTPWKTTPCSDGKDEVGGDETGPGNQNH